MLVETGAVGIGKREAVFYFFLGGGLEEVVLAGEKEEVDEGLCL